MFLRYCTRLYSTATKSRKRFYKNVAVSKVDDRVSEIHLDGRSVKTPKGNVFRISSEPLAVAIAQEWECQKDSIRSNQMHLTSLAMTALDNPTGHTKESFVDEIVKMFEMDTIFFLTDESEALAKLQTQRWGELIDWATEYLGVEVKASCDLSGPSITDESRNHLIRFLSIYNESALRGVSYASNTLKSVILALAAVQGRLTVEEAVKLASLEEEFQTQRWGRVEWAHDVEYQGSCARLAAAVIFVQLNSTSSHVVVEKI